MTDAEPRTLRVLMADDNHHVRKIVENAVERLAHADLRFEFVDASNGDEALAALEQDLDLAILDVNMPVLDGVRLLDRIRGRPEIASLPVLVVSADGDEARGPALAAGADQFLPKPLRLVDVQDAVRSLLRL